MNIDVRFYAMLRFKLGCASVQIETDRSVTVRELLKLVCARFDYNLQSDLLGGDAIKKGTLILIDGRNVLHLDQLDTQIDRDCVVSLFPPAGGG